MTNEEGQEYYNETFPTRTMTITPKQRAAAFQAMRMATEHALSLKDAGCILNALIAAGWQPVGEGSVVVPREPTDKMIEAAGDYFSHGKWDASDASLFGGIYRAMIGAKGIDTPTPLC